MHFDLHNTLIGLNQPLLESPNSYLNMPFVNSAQGEPCSLYESLNLPHNIFKQSVLCAFSLGLSLLLGCCENLFMHIHLCMLGNPKLSNVQER